MEKLPASPQSPNHFTRIVAWSKRWFDVLAYTYMGSILAAGIVLWIVRRRAYDPFSAVQKLVLNYVFLVVFIIFTIVMMVAVCVTEDWREDLRTWLRVATALAHGLVRSIKWFLSKPLEALLAAAAIILVLIGFGRLLFETDQGRDLLQLAEDRGSALVLFSGLSVAMYFVTALLCMIATANFSSQSKARFDFTDGAWWLVSTVAAMGMAALAGYERSSIGFGLAVYFIGTFIGLLVSFPILRLLASGEKAGYILGGVSIVGLVTIAGFPGEIGASLGSALTVTVAVMLWILFVSSLAGIGVLSGRPGHGLKLAFLCIVGLWAAKIGVTKLLEHTDGYRDLDYLRYQQRGPQPQTVLAASGDTSKLPTLIQAYEAWRKKQTEPKPQLVVVAAAGGGIRASYWTSLVLTRLADAVKVPNLRGKLFAASGVSGGSLGLGLFYGLLSSIDPKCTTSDGRLAGATRKEDQVPSDWFGPLERCVNAFHRNDFLAGPLAATFAGYPVNALLPIFPHRSEALEIGWERAWRDTVGPRNNAADTFSNPITALWHDGGNRPLLLLNATSVRSGERVLAADVRIDSPEWVSFRTKCRINLAENAKFPLSAAIGASARFPFVSDWGWLRRRPATPGCEELEGVADGGFYDNYGAATMVDLLDGLKKYASINLQTAVKLVVIQITSNPTREMGCLFRTLDKDGYKPASGGSAKDNCSPAAEKPKFSEPSVTDVAMQVRDVTGIEVAEQLRTLTCNLRGSYYHFAMTGAKDVPLGWTLSITSQNRLSNLLRDESRPAKARLDRLVYELKTGDKRGQCAASP